MWYNMCKKLKIAQEVRKGCDDMTEEAKAARRAYKREWARRNPDKVKAIQDRYWQRKAEQAQSAPGDGTENNGK